MIILAKSDVEQMAEGLDAVARHKVRTLALWALEANKALAEIDESEELYCSLTLSDLCNIAGRARLIE